MGLKRLDINKRCDREYDPEENELSEKKLKDGMKPMEFKFGLLDSFGLFDDMQRHDAKVQTKARKAK